MRSLLVAGLFIAALQGGARAQVQCNLASDLGGKTDANSIGLLERLKGTVAMEGNNTCSGALVTFQGRSSSSPALVLSAGHCSDRGKLRLPLKTGSIAVMAHGEALYRTAYRRPLTLDTGRTDAPRTCIEAEEAVYATLTGGDILLLRLTETYSDIERRTGVTPFVISQDSSFSPGLAIRMPSSLWQTDRECQVEATVEKLQEYGWLWGPVLRLRVDMDTCIAPHGVSGAPVIRKDTKEVIGVMGTVSDASAGPCELNNPCEVGADGSVQATPKDQNYMHFVHQLYACLDASRSLDLAVPGCPLAKP
jgi:hypothetical protein